MSYKTLWYDYNRDVLVPDEYCLEQRYRNLDTRIRKTMVVGEKEAYNVVAYFSIQEGRLPPTDGDIGVMVTKHVKSIEKPVDVV